MPVSPRKAVLSLLLLLLVLCGTNCAARPGEGGRCPPRCRCQEEPRVLRVDCSELGLTCLPAGISPLTTFLDLSMNNLTSLKPFAFSHLPLLQELRLAGNDLAHVPKSSFAGLGSLRVLMLQNNQLREVPREALRDTAGLHSLRLDANHLSRLPAGSLRGVAGLRHLWLDDNALTEVPVGPLNELPALQALTLALNRIAHIPNGAFRNLSGLVVLDLNYNQLSQFPKAIKDLPNLRELAFHSNRIEMIPEHAFRSNPLLKTIHFYDNPIRVVGKTAFQNLAELQTLLLRGAAEVDFLPILNGTTNLESLTLTGTNISSLPQDFCKQMHKLQVLDLSNNHIQTLHSLQGCLALEEISLQNNELKAIGEDTFQYLAFLKSLDLSENKIQEVHPHAFLTLRGLSKLDLSSNGLSWVPTEGLEGLVHLKLGGNPALIHLNPTQHFPHLRTLEVPFAYQCCAYGYCETPVSGQNQWLSDGEDIQKRDVQTYLGQPDIYDLDSDEFFLELEDDLKLQHTVHCTPTPGAFKPCEYLLGSWMVRLGVWFIFLLAISTNAVVALATFCSCQRLTSLRLLLGLLSLANLLTGVYSGAMAGLDAATYGRFAEFGARWETGVGCRALGFTAVFASESSIFLLAAAALERALSVRRLSRHGKAPSMLPAWVMAGIVLALAVAMAALPLFHVGNYGQSPLCLPLPNGDSSSLAYLATLVLLNSLAFLSMAITYTWLYCSLEKEDPLDPSEGAMVKHVAWLIFIDCVLYCPVAFFSFAGLLRLVLVEPEVPRTLLLLLSPLPACLNPLLYLLFTPLARQDLSHLWKRLVWRHYRGPEDAGCDSSSTVSAEATQLSSDPLVQEVWKPLWSPGVRLVPCQQSRRGGGRGSCDSAYTDEEGSVISDASSEQLQACTRACFYQPRGKLLP
ncbi:leucine-rich repeat-containing G-protein coupled receptor 5 isoform X2 [Petromyzon marinus]|uniref:leucine-rich repeat-containing G-protein coupled receptor 5 isoform X2 n=1 Tax=Petromyzon marinus TaxID=7757 RepID=UPI003F70A032